VTVGGLQARHRSVGAVGIDRAIRAIEWFETGNVGFRSHRSTDRHRRWRRWDVRCVERALHDVRWNTVFTNHRCASRAELGGFAIIDRALEETDRALAFNFSLPWHRVNQASNRH
jgi:hypothetical protein